MLTHLRATTRGVFVLVIYNFLTQPQQKYNKFNTATVCDNNNLVRMNLNAPWLMTNTMDCVYTRGRQKT